MAPAQRGVLLHLSMEENKVMLRTETGVGWRWSKQQCMDRKVSCVWVALSEEVEKLKFAQF